MNSKVFSRPFPVLLCSTLQSAVVNIRRPRHTLITNEHVQLGPWDGSAGTDTCLQGEQSEFSPQPPEGGREGQSLQVVLWPQHKRCNIHVIDTHVSHTRVHRHVSKWLDEGGRPVLSTGSGHNWTLKCSVWILAQALYLTEINSDSNCMGKTYVWPYLRQRYF